MYVKPTLTYDGFGEEQQQPLPIPWVPLIFGGVFAGLLIYVWVVTPSKSK
jgi:hypothetical protein